MKTYGPVPSWRLGNSLGVDLVEAPAGYDKICSFDCVYCQLGHKAFRMSSPKSIEIKEEDFDQLRRKIEQTRPDYITFSGEGEPTLNLNLGYVANRIREMTDVPIAVLTNASFVYLQRVREGLNSCDLVLAKIDAPSQDLFESINRPYKGASLSSIVRNLKEIDAKLAIQTLLFSYDGLTNADESSIEGLIGIYREINSTKPISVYLGTAYRPTSTLGLESISERQLRVIANQISSALGFEVVYYQEKEPKRIARKLTDEELREEILALLKRRPCTLEDVFSRFSSSDAKGALNSLTEKGVLGTSMQDGKKFYCLKKGKTNV